MEVDATPFWRLDFNGFHPTSGPFWLTCLTYLLQELLQQTGQLEHFAVPACLNCMGLAQETGTPKK